MRNDRVHDGARRRILTLGVLIVAAWSAAPACNAQVNQGIIEAAVVVGGVDTDFRALSDLDGDGLKEAVSVAFPGTNLVVQAWRFGVTQPTIAWQVTYPNVANPAPSRVAAGDFDGDGREDFALSIDGTVGWWLSNGTAAPPSIPWIVVAGGSVVGLIAADFNDDGRADLAVQTSSSVSIYTTQAVGPPILTGTTGVPVIIGATHMFLAEANTDRTPDLALTLASGGVQVRLHAVTNGVIGNPQVLGPVIVTSQAPTGASGDIDGDGDSDIVVFANNSRSVLRRVGPTTYSIEASQPAGAASLLADIDGDGTLDGVGYATTAPAGAATTTTGARFALQLNAGGGALGFPFSIAAVGGNTLAGATDLDGDGDIDLVGGRCVDWTAPGFPQPPHAIGLTVEPGTIPFDFDRDGDPDLGFGFTNVVRNEGDSTFVTLSPTIAPLTLPSGGALAGTGLAGDFDGDGAADILVRRLITGPPPRLLRNSGGGGLVDGGDASAPGTSPFELVLPTSLTIQIQATPQNGLVADVDGDGDQDIVVRFLPTTSVPSTVCRVWLNDGNGFFAPGVQLNGEYPLAAADLDGDSIIDLVVASQTTGTISGALRFLHGLGGGAFGGATTIEPAFDLRSTIAVGDVDGDGDLDLGVSAATTLSVRLNGGSGNFTTALLGTAEAPSGTPFGSPTEPIHRAFFADMNGDGSLDFVGGPVASAGAAYAFVPATAPGVFGTPIVQPLDVRIVADFDGDGDVDVATGDQVGLNARYVHGLGGVRSQHGSALAGSAGFVPVLGDVGPFRVGTSGAIRITNGLGGAQGWLVLGLAEVSVPIAGGILQVSPDILLPIQLDHAAGGAGRGSLSIPWTLPASIAGWTLHHQVALSDAAAPFGVSFTRVLSVNVGL